MLTRHAYLLFTLLLIASWGFVFAKIPGVGLIFRGLCLAFVTLGVVSTAIRRLVAGKSTQTTQLDKAKEVRFVDEVELPAAA